MTRRTGVPESARAAGPEIPGLLLGTESLLGVSLATRDRVLQVATRFREAESLAVTLSKAVGAGADGVLATPSRWLGAALDELPRPVPLYALLPNVPEYVRDSSDLGLLGAALKRVRQAGLGARARLGATGLARLAGALRSDFSAMVPLLLELESAWLGARDLRGVVVASAITDLALAGRHRRFFERTCRFVRRRFGGIAGFETQNLGHLLAALREWRVRPDLVIGPVNPRGLSMKPTPEELLAELARAEVPVLAKELRAGGVVSLGQGADYALAAGARGLVADLVDLEDLGAELPGLRRLLGATPGPGAGGTP